MAPLRVNPLIKYLQQSWSLGRSASLAAALLVGFGLGRLSPPPGKEAAGAPSHPLLGAGAVDRQVPGAEKIPAAAATGLGTSPATSSLTAGGPVDDLGGVLRGLLNIKDPSKRRAAIDQLIARLAPKEIHQLFQEYDRMKTAGDFSQHPNIARAAASTWELIVASLVDHGPEAFLASRLQESGQESSSEEFESILGAWSEKDLGATLAYFQSNILPLKPSEFQGAAASLANNYFRMDPDRAAAWLQTLPEPTRNFCGPYALRSLAQQDPAAAARLIAAHESLADRDDLSRHAAQRWAISDPVSAFQWASQLPAGLAVSALDGVMDQWMKGDFQVASRHADQLDPGLRSAILPALTVKAPDDLLPALARQMEGQPGDEHITAAAANLTQRWAETDPTAASQWLLDQPAGPMRDSAIRSFTERLAQEDPGSAFEWAAVIVDTEVRSETLDAGIRDWLDKDPEAARHWVQSAHNLTSADRDRLLRRTGK